MSSSDDLSGRVAIVTGGAKGIGRAVALRLARQGARVHVLDLRPAVGAGLDSVEVDVTGAAGVAAAVASIAEREPHIDILVNCAGTLNAYLPFERLDADECQRVVAVNLLGTMNVCRAVLPVMRRARHGRIVNFGSLAGKEGLAGLVPYSAASGGVIAFTKALAKEIVDDGVTVNVVAPGPFDTEMIRDLGADAVAAMVASSPMKRLGRVDEAAALVAWLCSDACSFTTGAVFDLSGGRAGY